MPPEFACVLSLSLLVWPIYRHITFPPEVRKKNEFNLTAFLAMYALVLAIYLELK